MYREWVSRVIIVLILVYSLGVALKVSGQEAEETPVTGPDTGNTQDQVEPLSTRDTFLLTLLGIGASVGMPWIMYLIRLIPQPPPRTMLFGSEDKNRPLLLYGLMLLAIVLLAAFLTLSNTVEFTRTSDALLFGFAYESFFGKLTRGSG